MERSYPDASTPCDGVTRRLAFNLKNQFDRTQWANHGLIAARCAEFAAYERLASPRVLTSDGESLFGDLKRDDLPANALPGLPVSTGCVDGRTRVVTDIAISDFEPGDILVTAYTDPSWMPLSMAVAGLVTEGGGQMSHGAVIAREYGLPAVMAVQHATRRIQDGQMVRFNRTRGVVTILPAE